MFTRDLYPHPHPHSRPLSASRDPRHLDILPSKWRLRNERRNSILMTRHYPDLGSASDWLNQISHAVRPIRSTKKYGISVLVPQTSFGGETSSVAKCFLRLRSMFGGSVSAKPPLALYSFRDLPLLPFQLNDAIMGASVEESGSKKHP